MNNSFCITTSIQKKVGGILSCLFALFLLASCQSYKKVPYLQDSEIVGQVTQQETLYDARIMPKDQLTIMVSCTNPELAAPFNLGMTGSAGLTAGNSQGASQSSQQTYLVDNEGNINFPVLGTLKVGGLTKKGGRANDSGKVETLHKRDSDCYCTYGQLQNLCVRRSR